MKRIRGMRPITRRSVIALLVAILSVGLLAGASSDSAMRPDGIYVNFLQLNWLGLNKTVRFPASRVGVAELSFDSAAADLLVGDGVYVNIVTKVPGNRAQWAVRNLHLSYPDEERMLGSGTRVQFGLNIPNGVRVSRLEYLLSVTDEPLPAAPRGKLVRTSVRSEDYLTGGTANSNLPLTIGPWVGSDAGKAFFFVARTGSVAVAVDKLPQVNEDVDGCAPGGVARSIKYMADAAGVKVDDVQSIYRDLFNNMGTQSPGGTTDPNLEAGKNKYNKDKGLGITTSLNYGVGANIGTAIDTLNKKGDVEILITWADGSGHVAMITSIIDNGDGTYQITYVDDPNQGDGKPASTPTTITVKADGTFPGGKVDGFVIETMKAPAPAPAPSPAPAPAPTPPTGTGTLLAA